MTRGNVLLILLINALVSLFISIAVFFVLSFITGHGRAPAPQEQMPTMTAVPLEAATKAGSPAQPSKEPGAEQARPDVYVVRTGDNLSLIAARFGVTLDELMAANGIDNPDWIGVGQKLVVPNPGGPAPTSTLPPVPTVTETPLPFDPPTAVPTISPTSAATEEETGPGTSTIPTPEVGGDAAPASEQAVSIDSVQGVNDVEAEEVVISNTGKVADLEGWTLTDEDGNTFTFPSLVLWSGAELRIHSGEGKNTPTHLYWNRTEPVWNSSQEVATLRDADGRVVATYYLE